MERLDDIELAYLKKDLPQVDVGDTVDVHLKIVEGDKERVQVFRGTVISRRGRGTRETVTVRRIVQGEGVERIFPLHSPKIVKIVVRRKGKVRRAKLFFLRDRVGKSTRLQERMGVEIPGDEGSTDAATPAAGDAEAPKKDAESKPAKAADARAATTAK